MDDDRRDRGWYFPECLIRLFQQGALTADEMFLLALVNSYVDPEKGCRKSAARAVSDATLEKVCPIAGSPKQCIQKLEEYRAAGCTQMMLELWGDDRLQQARLFGEKVLPHFHNQ